jgi:hypothetical protein
MAPTFILKTIYIYIYIYIILARRLSLTHISFDACSPIMETQTSYKNPTLIPLGTQQLMKILRVGKISDYRLPTNFGLVVNNQYKILFQKLV